MAKNLPISIKTSFGRVFILIFALIFTSAFVKKIEIDQQYSQSKSLEEFEKIAEEIKMYLAQEPNQADWHWRLARSYYSIAKRTENDETSIHHYNLCIEHSNRSLEIKPTAIGYFFRALCLGKKGEMKGIWSSLGIIDPFEKDMKKALEMDPTIQNGGPNRALGKLYLELPFFLGGSTDQSIYHLKEAVRLSPRHAENHLGLAQAYYAKNNLIDARKSLSTLLSLTHNIDDDEELLNIRTEGQELMEKISQDFQNND